MDFSKELIDVLNNLLPGFVMAWIFYGLTSHQKPSQFERIVQALIFNLFIQVFIWLAGTFVFRESWPEIVKNIAAAVFLGFSFSAFSNNDRFHKVCRWLKITKETAYPTEWFSSFAKVVTYVVLHLKDGRRLYGWPLEWPSDPAGGHFALQDARWLQKDGGDPIELDGVERVLVNVENVELVEFMKPVV